MANNFFLQIFIKFGILNIELKKQEKTFKKIIFVAEYNCTVFVGKKSQK